MKRKNGTAPAVLMKTVSLQIKEAGPDDGLGEGEFKGYASVFGNVDSYGDIVEPGAFKRTLEEWKATGDTIPVLWGHDMFDPFSNIGGLLSAEEDDHGLLVHGSLDVTDNPKAAQVYRLMKGRRTRKMSFAYAVRDEKQDDAGNHLNDLDLFEVSVVQVPANQEAEILDVKRAADSLLKAGRTLSAKNEASLRAARDAIDAVLDSLAAQEDSEDGKVAPATSTTGKASGTTPAKESASDEDPAKDKSGASSEEPKSSPSVESWGDEFDLLATAFGKD